MIKKEKNTEYVLLTEYETYFVEYLIGELILSSSIDHAMIFDNIELASRFKKMLIETCDMQVSINTFID